MAGLLDFLSSEAAQPGLLSLMGAGGGLGQLAGGLLQGQQSLEDRKIKQAYIRSQIAENESQARARERQGMQQQRVQDILSQAFGSGGMPGQMTASGGGQAGAQQAASAFGLTLPQVAALKASGGPDLLEVYKYATDGVKRDAGATYINPVTGAREYVPKVGEGITMQGGQAGAIPGYADAQASIAGAQARAVEGAKYPYDIGRARETSNIAAENDLVTVPLPGGPRQMTRAMNRDMVQQQGGGLPPVAGNQQLSPQLQQLIAQDAAANGIANPITNFQGARPGQAYGLTNATPMQSMPGVALQTPAQAEADRVTAVAGATKGAEDRNKSDQFTILNRQIDKAKNLLNSGPTASGIGAVVDQVANVFGVNSSSAEKASALDAAAGWMVQNVPKAPGAQSDAELRDYAKAVGNVGNRSMPVQQRLAALKTAEDISKIWQERAGGGAPASEQPQQPKAAPQRFDTLPTANASNKGMKLKNPDTGEVMRSNGMQWIKE